MMDGINLPLFLAAALILAAVPGPGIFYVAARTISGGSAAGIASTAGTALGGIVHVIAGAIGVSAIILASAELFTALKFCGALYLIWLGIRTFREAGALLVAQESPAGARRALYEGIVVEALNPKTAAFFLAFLPQFVDPSHSVAAQFISYGLISVVLNTSADVVVTTWAAKARAELVGRPSMIVWARQAAGAVMCGIGASLLFARRSV